MFEHTSTDQRRVDRFIRDVLTPAVAKRTVAVDVSACPLPGEPEPFEAVRTRPFQPVEIGEPWGRAWSTTWFRIEGTIPEDWAGEGFELVVDIGFTGAGTGFQAEALAYDHEGHVLKAVQPRNRYVPIDQPAGTSFTVYLEAAGNPDIADEFSFLPTAFGRPETAPTHPLYVLSELRLIERDRTVWELLQDVRVLVELAAELPESSTRRARISAALNKAVQAVDPTNVTESAELGRAALASILDTPATASAHRAFAVGHAHIDSAWLWPTRETARKVARSFANALHLMDSHDGYIFAASSAQQYAWLKAQQPELFERVRARVREGRFVPVGGMWVESDAVLPGGEALVRQFLEGKAFFAEEFEVEPAEVWLPDSFGYSAALPQIAVRAGMTALLTQKLSWNDTNRFPHSTFAWEGIDGTRIFTHFPPVDSYESPLSATDLAKADRNFQDKKDGSVSLIPFGYGDGGGGPTREMLASADRARDLEGSTRVVLASPAEFFSAARGELAHPPVWVGELYLELHRGTFTSQARTKRGNRRSERLLHEAELWCATAAIRKGEPYPYDALQAAWRMTLLNQFHDILPGSSIGWVYDQAEADYETIREQLEPLIDGALRSLFGAGGNVSVNSSPTTSGHVSAFSAAVRTTEPVRVQLTGTGAVLSSVWLSVELDSRGRIVSMVDSATGRQVVPDGWAANDIQFFHDLPHQWDAWDVDPEFEGREIALDDIPLLEVDGETVVIQRLVGSSEVRQRVTLAGDGPVVEIETRVDWRERQKFLKLAHALDIHATEASSETQFGHVVRPIHRNTSWDVARTETPTHRWTHVGEPDFGVAVVNDVMYGQDIARHENPVTGTHVVVRQSLLRAPNYPDPSADAGTHTFTTALAVGDKRTAIREGYRVARPLRTGFAVSGPPLISSDNDRVLVETVKLAHDRSGDLIVRLYESLGTRATANLTMTFPFKEVFETDLLERPIESSVLSAADGRSLSLRVKPFEIVTLRLRPRKDSE